jgi:hypothetical protein
MFEGKHKLRHVSECCGYNTATQTKQNKKCDQKKYNQNGVVLNGLKRGLVP